MQTNNSTYYIHLTSNGKGAPLLLLHGYLANQSIFDELIPELLSHFRVFRADLPGHGKSETPPENYSFDEFAARLWVLLDGAGLNQPIRLVGHSMGAYVTCAMARLSPERVKNLTVLHALPTTVPEDYLKLRMREARLIAAGKQKMIHQRTLSNNLSAQNAEAHPEWIARLHEMADEVSEVGLLQGIAALNHREDETTFLASAQFPICWGVGMHDRVLSAERQLKSAKAVKNADIWRFTGSGHLAFWEEKACLMEKLIQNPTTENW